MASLWHPDRTPPANEDRQPTEFQIQFFRNFPSLGSNFTIVAPASAEYNCFAWSLGFNSRWIDGGTPESMQRLYGCYFYIPTQSADEAEIDVYMRRDTPQTRTANTREGQRQLPISTYNLILHAHRNDFRNARRGCTSKMQEQMLIRHDRMALHDDRPWTQAAYGQICGYYRKSPEHPLNPGKAHNKKLIPPALPGPMDKMWEVPRAYPPGHPLDSSIHGIYAVQTHSADNGVKKALSLRFYAPYQRIPPPSQAAVQYALRVLSAMREDQARVELIKRFATHYRAWKKTWFVGPQARSANSITRTQVPEFDHLVRLGSRVVPLVVAQLCCSTEFMAIQLYNALEKDPNYKVSPWDAPNFLVLQRHANLIVELNNGRYSRRT